jgi:2-polyprenyl-6-methoxyphenol hydroxylase-like FAD-dependent oxidoreductase
MEARPTIIIVGAGIGGLTAAIALRQAGFDVEVYERTAELKEIGAGIGLAPNATRALKHLGLMQQVIDRGTIIEAIVTYNSRGKMLGRTPTNLLEVPSVCLHRADLQQVLLSALPAKCVRLGEEFVELKKAGTGVRAHFASGRTASGYALIGADGLRSRVRAQLVNDGAPVYRGYQCWRGVCSRPASEVLTETCGLGIRVGIVPIGFRGTAWWCCANEPEATKEDPGDVKSKLLTWIGNWHQPIPEVLGATEPKAIIKTSVLDRRPVRTWSKGCCTLLGDAAHPMTPNMGQGGCMAIEDGFVLARCLSASPDAETALKRYERLRYSRTAAMVKVSRYFGAMGQWQNPGAAWLRNIVLRFGSGKASTRGYVKFLSYDVSKVEGLVKISERDGAGAPAAYPRGGLNVALKSTTYLDETLPPL